MGLAARLQTLTTGRGRKALVVTTALVLVLLIGHTAAALVWLLFEGPSVAPVAAVSKVGAAPRRDLTPEMAGDWKLFGDAAAQPVAGDPANAPQTSLALQLLGVFSSGNDRHAGAVIAERGKDGELYRVGALLPGGATLEKVEKEQVVLRRRGQLETLRFDSADSSGGGGPAAGRPVAAAGDAEGGFRPLKDRLAKPESGEPDDSKRARFTQYADDFKNNPDVVLNDLGLKPGSGGYSVGEGASAEMIRGLGLRPGDTIVSVNGKSLGNMQSDAAMVDEVKASGEARVEVKRGSQTFTVNYPLQ
jgi:general secretion pathway protein C